MSGEGPTRSCQYRLGDERRAESLRGDVQSHPQSAHPVELTIMKTHIAVLLGFLLAFAGCQTYTPVDNRVVLLESTSNHLQVSNVRLLNEGGTPLLVADVRNPSSTFRREFEWCVEFRNSTGQHVSRADTRWSSESLGPEDSKQLQLTASDPAATDFIIKFRNK